MEHGEFAVISNALPSVDSFFLIGELLFSLNYLTLLFFWCHSFELSDLERAG